MAICIVILGIVELARKTGTGPVQLLDLATQLELPTQLYLPT